MSKDRKENMDLEISMCIAEIEQLLKEDLSEKEEWIVRFAFLTGNTYGLDEARKIVKDK